MMYSLRIKIKIDDTVDFWLQIWPFILLKKIMQKHENLNYAQNTLEHEVSYT